MTNLNGTEINKENVSEKKEFITPIPKGVGGLKYYKYYVLGLTGYLPSKKMVNEALKVGLPVFRYDIEMGRTEKFHYRTNRFRLVSCYRGRVVQ